MSVISSITELRTFERDIAHLCKKAKVEADIGDGDWDFERFVLADKIALSKVCEKMKEVQRISEGNCKAVSTSALETIQLF